MNYQQLIEYGVDQWNQWRIDHPNLRPDLSGVNLSQDYLFEANLSDTNLSGANLSRACLIGADLSRANLRGANLRGAYLSRANLLYANLRQAQLVGASLRETNLSNADLFEAQIVGADLALADLTGTCLAISARSLKLMARPTTDRVDELATNSKAKKEHSDTTPALDNHPEFQSGIFYLPSPQPDRWLKPPGFIHPTQES